MSVTPDIKISFNEYHNIIENKLCSTPTTRHGICPSTEEPLWECPVSGPEDVDRAVSAAKTAFPTWSQLSVDERVGYLEKLADALEAHRAEFVELLGKEAGKPRQSAAMEFALAMSLGRDTLKLRLEEKTLVDTAEKTVVQRFVPLGVGVGIIPWNFPLVLAIAKAVAALLTGNTFILKPSEYTPYSGLKLAELASRIFPPGVFQALSGEANLGPLFTDHPDIAKISFTGSVATGKKVMAACAGTLKRVTLELGGNDAAIVCEDVDIDVVAEKIAQAAFLHTGQVCFDPKRIYVHANIYDKFLSAMVSATKGLKFGNHDEEDAFSGPTQNSMQYEKLRRLYAEIETEGWKTALGGNPTDTNEKKKKGYHMPPTIIDNPPDSSSIVTLEPFGPIVPLLKWSSEEEVISRANNTRWGLGGSVWSRDEARARRMAGQLEAGTVWVNAHFAMSASVPAGGHKESGIGMEWGEMGLQGWCNPQVCWVQR
ncbi:aldehyde dehydrogenase [Poronia punctata]|nr:aldehyde dehydrogenase [Poronia punctata]